MASRFIFSLMRLFLNGTYVITFQLKQTALKEFAYLIFYSLVYIIDPIIHILCSSYVCPFLQHMLGEYYSNLTEMHAMKRQVTICLVLVSTLC